MKHIRLSDDNVATLPAGRSGETMYSDRHSRSGVPGLFLRVRAGKRVFLIQWSRGGQQRRFTIGTVGVMTLDQARVRARELLLDIERGGDPATAKAEALNSMTFLRAMEGFLDHCDRRLSQGDLRQMTVTNYRRALMLDLKPLHDVALASITRRMLAEVLNDVFRRAPGQADMTRVTAGTFFKWAIGQSLIEENPAAFILRYKRKVSRDRVLTDAELVAIWNACGDDTYGRIVRLLALTGQRLTEISHLEHSEIGDRLLSLNGKRVKNHRDHEVPLGELAQGILASQPKGRAAHVFGKKGFVCGDKYKRILDRDSGVTDWTHHDLRRTAATGMANLGVQPHIIEAVLNHVSGHKSGVAGIYNRAVYRREKRGALEIWEGHIRLLLAQASGANVVALKRETVA